MTPDSPVSDIRLISGGGRHAADSPEYELYLVLQGTARLVSGSQRNLLKTQDLFLSAPEDSAVLYPAEGALLVMASLRASFFSAGTVSANAIRCNSAADPSRDYRNLRNLLSTLALSHFQEREGAPYREISLSYAIADCLVREYASEDAGTSEDDRSSARLSVFHRWLEEHYRETVSLKDIAASLYLHPNYLPRWIRLQTGKTFLECLNDVRLRHALHDLETTDLRLTTVASESGLSGSRALNRLVRELFGCSAAEYRERYRSSGDTRTAPSETLRKLALPLLRNQAAGMIAITEELSPKGGNYSFDFSYPSPGTPLRRSWRRIINLGTIPSLSRPGIEDMLRNAKQHVGFRYGRIENILSDDAVPRINSRPEYNFSRFDEAIRLLLSSGYTPYLVLSWRKDYIFVSDQIIYAAQISLGDDTLKDDYPGKLSALIRHAVNTFGLSEVDRWVFEVPFLTDEYLNPDETPAQFGKRLRQTWMVVKQVTPNALVGGGTLNCVNGTEWIREVLACMADEVFSPDFVSISCFPFERKKGPEPGFIYTADPDYIRRNASEVRKILDSNPNYPKKLHISSWGPDIKSGNYLNDSCFQASFVVKNCIDMAGIADAAGFQQLTDAGNEYLDATKILFGGTGLISLSRFRKPGFGAFRIMSQLYKTLIEKDNGMIATKGPQDSCRLILCNYIHPSERFQLYPAVQFDPSDTYSFFDESTMNVSLRFFGMRPGAYKITTIIINREHGSILDEWQRYGMEDHLGAADWDYLSSAMHPLQTAALYRCEEGEMELHYVLQPHEIRLIDIVREL